MSILLVLTLLTNVNKALFGANANLVVDVVFLVCVALLLHLPRIRYPRLFALLLLYLVVHGGVQVLSYGGLFGANNYTDYRNLIRGVVVVVLLFNTSFTSRQEVDRFFASVFTMVSCITLLNIYGESIAYYVARLDLRSLIYVQSVETSYGDPGSRSRIPTLLGAPHMLALVQGSLVFVFWHLAKRRFTSWKWFWLSLGAVLLAQSRLQILVVFSTLAVYGSRYAHSSRWRPAAALAGLASLALVIVRFGGDMRLASSQDFLDAFDILATTGSFWALSELIVWPPLEEAHRILFGVGAATGSEQYNNMLSLAMVEISLITDIIPRYGLVFAGLYYAILLTTFRRLRRTGQHILALAVIPFMVSPLHMWLVNNTFVSDAFFVMLAYCLLITRVGDVDGGGGGMPSAELAAGGR